MVQVLTWLASLSLGVGVVTAVAPPTEKDEAVVFEFADPAIVESSGLIARDGLFVTVNDSGDSARVFTVDPESGRTVGTTTWPGSVSDTEALAPARDGQVWVGDIGDNLHRRSTIRLHRVPTGPGEEVAVPASYDLDYRDGPHDAETLLSHPSTGRLYVVSKEVVGGRLYAAPRTLSAERPNRMEGLNGEVMPLATDGAFFPDGRHLLIRGYARAHVYTFPALEEVAEVDLPSQQQGEGVAIDEKGRIYLSSEGPHTAVLELRLPKKLRATVLGIAPKPTEQAPPAEEPATPIWPYLFMGGMGAVVLLGAVRLVWGGSRD